MSDAKEDLPKVVRVPVAQTKRFVAFFIQDFDHLILAHALSKHLLDTSDATVSLALVVGFVVVLHVLSPIVGLGFVVLLVA